MKFSDSSVCSETLEWDYECEEVYNEETFEWEQVCSDGYIARKRSELENKNLYCDTTDIGLECGDYSTTNYSISFNDYVSGTTNICPNLEYMCSVTCELNADGTFSCE